MEKSQVTERKLPERSYFRKRSHIGRGFDTTRPNRCVVNLARLLIGDPQNIIFIPRGTYPLGGVPWIEDDLVQNPLGKTLVAVKLRSNESIFNFSFLCVSDEKRLTYGADGQAAGVEDEKQFRTINFIRDGKLLLKHLLAVVSEATFIKLQEAGVFTEEEKYVAGRAYVISLEDMPLTSPAFSNATILGLVDIMKCELDLKAEAEDLKKRIKELRQQGQRRRNIGDQVRRVCGKQLPKGRRQAPAKRSYVVDCCEYRLDQYLPLPATINGLDLDGCHDRLRAVNKDLRRVCFLKRLIVFQMEVGESKLITWGPPRIPRRTKQPRTVETAWWCDQFLHRVTWRAKLKR